MSFGWSATDIVNLAQLAWRTVQNSRKACGEHAEITREVLALHLVLRRMEKEADRAESSPNDGHNRTVQNNVNSSWQELEAIATGCRNTLRALDQIIEKYGALSENGNSTRKLWQKVRFGNGKIADINELREKIVFYTSVMSLYLNLVSAGSMGRVERQLEEAGDDLKDVKSAVNRLTAHLMAGAKKGEGSILSTYTNDDKSVWKDFRRGLIERGFSSSFLHKHKKTIQAYFEELGSRGFLDEQEQSDLSKYQEPVSPMNSLPQGLPTNTMLSDNETAGASQDKIHNSDVSTSSASDISSNDAIALVSQSCQNGKQHENDTLVAPREQSKSEEERMPTTQVNSPVKILSVPKPNVESESESESESKSIRSHTSDRRQDAIDPVERSQDADFFNSEDFEKDECQDFCVKSDAHGGLPQAAESLSDEPHTNEYARWVDFLRCNQDLKDCGSLSDVDPFQIFQRQTRSEHPLCSNSGNVYVYISSPWGICSLSETVRPRTFLLQLEYRMYPLCVIMPDMMQTQLRTLQDLLAVAPRLERLLSHRPNTRLKTGVSDMTRASFRLWHRWKTILDTLQGSLRHRHSIPDLEEIYLLKSEMETLMWEIQGFNIRSHADLQSLDLQSLEITTSLRAAKSTRSSSMAAHVGGSDEGTHDFEDSGSEDSFASEVSEQDWSEMNVGNIVKWRDAVFEDFCQGSN